MALEQKLEFNNVYRTVNAFSYNENAPTSPHGRIIHDSIELFELLCQMNMPFSFKGEPFKSEKVFQFNKEYDPDFSKEMIIAVFQGQRMSGGYSIEITDIVEMKDKIIVSATAAEPSGGIATASITYPAHFVACKKSEKLVEFVWSAKDPYAEAVANCKKYIVSPKEKKHPKELDSSAHTSREERIRIMKGIGEEIYTQLKKDCKEMGLPSDFRFLDMVHTAFVTLEEGQVKELEKRGYNVYKSI